MAKKLTNQDNLQEVKYFLRFAGFAGGYSTVSRKVYLSFTHLTSKIFSFSSLNIAKIMSKETI